jgi:MraZ protein
LAAGSFDGVFCFPSIEADCIEGGGKALFDRYSALIDELPFGDPLRSALETTVLGGMNQLGFDTAGRITLPESLCEAFGLNDWVRWSAWAIVSRSGREDSFAAHARSGAARRARAWPRCAIRSAGRGGAAA